MRWWAASMTGECIRKAAVFPQASSGQVGEGVSCQTIARKCQSIEADGIAEGACADSKAGANIRDDASPDSITG